MKYSTLILTFIVTGCGGACPVASIGMNTCTPAPAPAAQQGVPGPVGLGGPPGVSDVNSSVPATTEQCPNGGTVVLIAQDTLGTGVYNTNDQGQTSFVVCNGIPGSTPLSVLYTIAPCGVSSSPYKEQLLCMNNGSILGSFSDNSSGLNTRLAFIPDGTFYDTDNSGCEFNVTIDSNGDSTLSYGNGSNQYSTWQAETITCTNNE